MENNIKRILEKTKKTFTNPIITIIIGLVGTLIYIILHIFIMRSAPVIQSILYNLYYVILIVYFTCVLLRLKKINANMKIIQYMLLGSIPISFVMYVITILYYSGISIHDILFIIPYIGFFIYFLNIFNIKEIKFANNKFFIASIFINILPFIILMFSAGSFFGILICLLNIILPISIVPYFYNYYNLVKGKKENGK